MTPPINPPSRSGSARPPSPVHDGPSPGSASLDDGVHHDALDGPLHNEDVAHEHADINVRAIIAFLVVLSAVTAVAAGAMYGLFRILDRQAAKSDAPPSPVAAPAAPMPTSTTTSPWFGNAPGPRLLTNEPWALRERRMEEQKRLQSSGWVDESAGIVHMPIDQAKKLLLQRGVPARVGDPVDPRLGTRAGAMSDASSGRRAVVQQKAPAAQQPAAQPPEAAKPPHKPGGH